jgi:HD-GYP domain-containing protein (c-di-GMP phosphodiesterase class II)
MLAKAIAEMMALSENQIEGIYMAGVVHDLGKIYVPAEILSKPSRLNDIEFNLIRTHSQVGYDLLKTIDFPWPIAQIVHQHHERLNGSGYPQGLSEEQILIEAKILCVADVVEAMASHRPYRPARGIDLALEHIQEEKNNLYDPLAVDCCMKLFTEQNFAFD